MKLCWQHLIFGIQCKFLHSSDTTSENLLGVTMTIIDDCFTFLLKDVVYTHTNLPPTCFVAVTVTHLGLALTNNNNKDLLRAHIHPAGCSRCGNKVKTWIQTIFSDSKNKIMRYMYNGVSWPSGLAYRTQVLVLATECGFESRPWHLCPWARHLIIIASLHPGVKWVPVRAELVD